MTLPGVQTPADTFATPPFVGRREELAVMDSFVRGVAVGRTRMLVIEAEAGGGKTSLFREFLTRGSLKNFTVISAEGDPGDQRPLRCLASALDCRLTSSDPRRARIAELLRGSSAQHAEGTLGAVHELVVDAFERAALAQPVLLFVDDLHWVDDMSLTTIGNLTRRLNGSNFGVVIGTRPSDRVRTALTSIGPQFLPIGPLSDEELTQLAQTISGGRPSDIEMEALGTVRTNPFLVSMLVENSTGADSEQKHALHSAGVLSPIRRMAASLEPTVRAFLELAAVAGREVDFDLLAAVADESVSSAVAMTREARRLGWMVTDGDSVRFRHDLLAEALVAGLPIDRRDRLHLRLGRALAELGHAPGRAAFHLDAASFLLIAADVPLVLRAMEGLAWDDDAMLRLAERSHVLDSLNLNVVRSLMRCLTARHRHVEALKVARPWLVIATPDSGSDNDCRATVAIRLLAVASIVSVNGSDEAVVVLRDSLNMEGLLDDQRVDVLNLLARLHWYHQDAEAVQRAAEEACRLGEQTGHTDGQVQALCSLSEAHSLIGAVDIALRYAERAIQLSRSHRGSASTSAELALGTALVSSGRFNEGLPVLTKSLHEAERAGDPVAMAIAQLAVHGSRFHIGDWDGFVTDADVMADIGRETGIRSGIVLPLGIAAVIAARRGDYQAVSVLTARVRVENTIGDSHPSGVVGYLLADIAEAEAIGKLATANTAAAQLAELLASAGYTAQSFVAMDAARLAWAVNDTRGLTTMARFTEAAAERAGTPTRVAMAAMCAALVGNEARQLMKAARQMAATERVWDGAVALHIAGLAARSEKLPEAAQLSADAAERYRTLGCLQFAEAAASGLEFSAVHRPVPDMAGKSRSKHDRLSPSERRVLELVTEGKANGDIAERLFISKRTVESHIASLFRKLAVTTRVGLAQAGSPGHSEIERT